MRLADFIVCDDIRTEMGNKISAMGIFGDEITLSVPTSLESIRHKVGLRLGFMIRLEVEETDPTEFDFTFSMTWNATQEEILSVEGRANAAANIRPSLLPISFVQPIELPDQGQLNFQLRTGNGEGRQEFRLRPLRVKFVSSASVAPAPR